ncbi:acyl-CoA synthetase [Streptomyces mayonensis]|uniref:acyl-CoA synthetase n=1 Tax=Streptomyces mayonensis TaxID=2750816 RepID=UPI001C1E16FE|nr:acyl-CoA synthetase [Streptomyces sp. A108]MBU6529655.1 acyl-CoA synthetase [Streptomyces sp. A108]
MTEFWPERYDRPEDLAAIEAVPLAARGLPATTYDVLSRAAGLWPERTALSVMPEAARWREPVTVTFAELHAHVNRVANLFYGLGVRREDAVALLSPNCQDLIVATLAAETAGVAAPVNGALNPAHVRELLRLSGARVLVAAGPELDEALWAAALELARGGAVRALVALRPTGADGAAPPLPSIEGVVVGYLSEAAEPFPGEEFLGTAPTADDIAAVFHTGGTTGLPKLAAHTHTNEVSDAWMIGANTAADEDSVVFAALPLFHVNALVVTLLSPLLKGQQVVWAGPLGYRDIPLFKDFWRIVEHYRVATMSAVPTVYAALATCPVDGADISSMRYLVVGASALPEGVRNSFEAATGIPLLEGYGLTEATCASVRGFLDVRRPGSVGQRMPYQHIKIVDVDAVPGVLAAELPAGEVGTVLISGPTVFPGYVQGRDEHGYHIDSLGKVVDGWLDTGDLGYLDKEGFLHLTGRAKDLIIRGGHNMDPRVIEDALLTHPAVTGAQAVGQPDRRAGEVPVAYVTVADRDVTEDELRAWAAAHVSEAAAAPKAVRVQDTLPLTAVGKPYKLPLRADATRRVLADVLRDIDDVEQVIAEAESGAVTATVRLRASASALTTAEVERRVVDYTVPCRIVTKQPGDA